MEAGRLRPPVPTITAIFSPASENRNRNCRRIATLGALSSELHWAVIWGGAKRMGEERTRERALAKILDPSKRASGLLCRGFLYSMRGVENVPYEGGVQNPFLGGVSFVRFSTPLFFPPPHGVL